MRFSGVHSLNEDGIEKVYWREDEYFNRGSEFPAIGEEDKPSMRTKRRLQDMLEEPQSDSDSDSLSSGYSPLDDAVEERELKVSCH